MNCTKCGKPFFVLRVEETCSCDPRIVRDLLATKLEVERSEKAEVERLRAQLQAKIDRVVQPWHEDNAKAWAEVERLKAEVERLKAYIKRIAWEIGSPVRLLDGEEP